MIGIIDYGVGNVKAFLNVYERLGVDAKVIKTVGDFSGITKLILPGVGAFDHAMTKLNESGLREKLEEMVSQDKLPILGICVGMQMLANSSEEGVLPGLGWISGRVKKLQVSEVQYKIRLPHMGWNTIDIVNRSLLFNQMDKESRFYFLHSYYFQCVNSANISTQTTYGKSFTSAVNRENIFGVQFHPEKSHGSGIQLLKNFSSL